MVKTMTKKSSRFVALLTIVALIVTQFATVGNVFAATDSQAERPFKTTATDPDGKNCPIEKTNKTVKYDKWQMGDPNDIVDIDLYVCKVPADADYVYLHRNGDNQIGNQKGEELWEDASIGEGKYYLSSFSTGSLLGEDNFIVIKEKPTNATYYAIYFEKTGSATPDPEVPSLPFKTTFTDGANVTYPIASAGKQLSDRYGTYDAYICTVPAGTKSVTVNAQDNSLYAGEDSVKSGAYSIDGKLGEAHFLTIGTKEGYKYHNYALYFEEEKAAPLPFKTTISDIDDDTDLYPIEATGETLTTEFGMELPAFVCKVPVGTDTVNIKKNGDFKYLNNSIQTIDFPEGWIKVSPRTGKDNFFIIETELTGKNIDFALYFEEDSSLAGDVADKTALRSAVAKADKIIASENSYEASTIVPLKAAIANARKILKNKNASENQVNTTLQELQNAIDNVKDLYRVIFKTKDGEIIEAEKGVFTLSALNEGKFEIADKKATHVNWNCVEEVSEQVESENADGEMVEKTERYFKFWINEDGTYQPKEPKEMDATVTFYLDGQKMERTFKINTVDSKVEAIKVFANGKELTKENALHVSGREWTTLTAKGLVDGKWINLPSQAFYIAPQKNTHIQGNRFALWTKATPFNMEVKLYGDKVSTSFTAIADYVPVESFKVTVPKTTWVLDAWNGASNNFLGLRYYADPAQDRGYHIEMTPANASNWDLNWESSDESIAYFDPLHSNGIVPKKAGNVEFTATSVDNPAATSKIAIEFVYKTPLEKATVPYNTTDKKVVMEGLSEMPLDISTLPENATEKRFNWSFDKKGIVDVVEKIDYIPFTATDEGYFEKENLGTVAVSYTLQAKKGSYKDQTVVVTGTPVDNTKGCEPVEFTVTVKADPEEAERVLNLKNGSMSLNNYFADIDGVFKGTANGKKLIAEPVVKDANGTKLVKGKDYTVVYSDKNRVKPGESTITVKGMGDYKGELVKTLVITPKAVKNVKARLGAYNGGYNDAYITWNKSEGATGYYVYARRPNKSAKWTSIGRVTTNKLTKKDLANGFKYEFKVLPYYKADINYKTNEGFMTTTMNTLMKVKAPVVKKSGANVKVNWTNIHGETGYQISRSLNKNKVNVVSTIKTTSGKTTLVKAKKGTKYFYKVRAYKTVKKDGKDVKVFAPWSEAKAFVFK